MLNVNVWNGLVPGEVQVCLYTHEVLIVYTEEEKIDALFLSRIYVRCKALCERGLSQGSPFILKITSIWKL